MGIEGQPPSPRQQQILALLAEGHDRPAIAARLYVSLSTVKWHMARLFEKLGAHSAAQAVHLGHLRGYLGPAGGAE